MKRRNGEFIGSYAPYGYVKDPNDKHALLVDPEAAEVVKSIFALFLSSMNKRGITYYQDWKDGEITRNDYRHMSEDYEQQIESLTRIMQTLTAEQEQLENGVDAESPCLTAFLKYRNIDKLTREILGELIDHIKVYEGGGISVKFKYTDEFCRIAEYIKLNSPMVEVAAG